MNTQDHLEEIEARVDEITELLSKDKDNRTLKTEMSRLMADHEAIVNRMIHG